MTGKRDTEVADYVLARQTWLRGIAYRLCQDWQRADDLVQATITDLYVQWAKASRAAGRRIRLADRLGAGR